MKREILFRGKRRDSEWKFGCYYKQSEFYGDKMEDHIIITSHEDLSFDQALFADTEIIGNIHDNPELLEGGDAKVNLEDIVDIDALTKSNNEAMRKVIDFIVG